MKILIYGLTADPPHKMHLEAPICAKQKLNAVEVPPPQGWGILSSTTTAILFYLKGLRELSNTVSLSEDYTVQALPALAG